MKFSALLAASLFAFFALAILPAAAQESQDATEAVHAPDLGTSVRVHGIQIFPVAGKPFSGRDHIEWVRALEDGNTVTTELYARLARDSQGRVYREHMSFVPINSGQSSWRREFDLLDPVNHTRTACMTATLRCTITNYRVPLPLTPRPPGMFDQGKRILVRESLGTDVIDGLNVVGSRETVIIAAGAVGNSQPLVSTREFWYSPDLEINLSTVRKDSREGTQAIHVVDLSRSDPDPAIFTIPANYRIEDIRESILPQD
jgi:hypothetical protein